MLPPILSGVATRAGLSASWNETLLIDEALERLLTLDVLVLFELLQLPVTYKRFRKHANAYEAGDGVHLVAWGFLRPGGDGERGPLLGRLKLQLYEYTRGIAK